MRTLEPMRNDLRSSWETKLSPNIRVIKSRQLSGAYNTHEKVKISTIFQSESMKRSYNVNVFNGY